jgi:hypothetical protein
MLDPCKAWLKSLMSEWFAVKHFGSVDLNLSWRMIALKYSLAISRIIVDLDLGI